MSGIPWRFDFMNMPKDGTWLLVLQDGLDEPFPECVRWNGVDFVSGDQFEVDTWEVHAWCPIDIPSPLPTVEGEGR